MTWVLDLDGVVWLGDEPIAGSSDAVARLRERGERVVVVTNNSAMTIGAYEAKLAKAGVPTAPEDIVTSAQVAAGMIEPGERVLVCAGDGVREALASRDIEVVAEGTADVVVVGWTRDFDYAHLTRAMRAVRAGARLLGTNDDATYPTPDGVLPGGGSLVAAVAYASGVTATFAGKPHPPMVAAVRARFGSVDVMVGDRPSTDGLLARGLGARFALVLSGVTTAADLPVEPAPDLVAPDLAGLVRDGGGR
ncbi:MAG: HAD-IIA family hydrolase [Acidimicrobiales bacterium]